jgi:hypothetical protein
MVCAQQETGSMFPFDSSDVGSLSDPWQLETVPTSEESKRSADPSAPSSLAHEQTGTFFRQHILNSLFLSVFAFRPQP